MFASKKKTEEKVVEKLEQLKPTPTLAEIEDKVREIIDFLNKGVCC